jgi:hypothetical protein
MKTISYELSNKLNKLRVRKRSYMVYLTGAHVEPELLPIYVNPQLPDTEVVNAYTLDEIIVMLPTIIALDNKEYWNYNYKCAPRLNTTPDKRDVYVSEYNLIKELGITANELCSFLSLNPAEAAGKLLVWCIENGHVKPEEL